MASAFAWQSRTLAAQHTNFHFLRSHFECEKRSADFQLARTRKYVPFIVVVSRTHSTMEAEAARWKCHSLHVQMMFEHILFIRQCVPCVCPHIHLFGVLNVNWCVRWVGAHTCSHMLAIKMLNDARAVGVHKKKTGGKRQSAITMQAGNIVGSSRANSLHNNRIHARPR